MYLAQVNIEGDNHVSRVISLIREKEYDTVCMQEVFEADVKRIEEETGMHMYFAPAIVIPRDYPALRMSGRGLMGVGIMTRNMPTRTETIVYAKPPGTDHSIPVWDGQMHGGDNAYRVAAIVEVSLGDSVYKIVTTHFTWSAGGRATAVQHAHMDRLLATLAPEEELVLCGDFNAPRGGELWSRLASHFTDNMPPHIHTTIDPTLHKASQEGITLELVVDGIFTTPRYTAKSVTAISGISDHLLIEAEIYC